MKPRRPCASIEAILLCSAKPLLKTTFRGKLTMAKVALRMFTARLTGKHWVGGGAALQGRMLHKALQAGVDIAVVALWLGHEHVQTTYLYLQADLTNKEQALEKLSPAGQSVPRFRPKDDLLAFLATL